MEMRPEELAREYINRTGKNLFITGRAGTGKTTFLRDIIESTHKKAIVAAPTGVAAINAGGVTLHSLFQLPFGTYLPSEDIQLPSSMRTEVNSARTLMRNLFLHNNKRRLLQEMELLVIDEVSMLRPDTLDAIDRILQTVRRKRGTPFGGVQMLFIGDLLQLPPVIGEDEWEMLGHFYESKHFFEALSIKDDPPVYIEFEKIYRQTDKAFIELLNHIRDKKLTEEDRDILNSYYRPGFKPGNEEGYIYLTTHNRLADRINNEALVNLKGRNFYFEPEIEKDFGENLFPLGDELVLKEGAQVMFIKNDPTGEGRFFNGKIGKIIGISGEEIEVGFEDGGEPVLVEKYTWYHKRYRLNEEDEIKEEIKGTFTQYPLKLAWAVTIHKSQGLSFDKAIIDVERAFAPGQVYVALSRLRTLEGLVLSSTFPRQAFRADPGIESFVSKKQADGELLSILEREARIYFEEILKQTFSFAELAEAFSFHLRSYTKDERRSAKQRYKGRVSAIEVRIRKEDETARRFRVELTELFASYEERGKEHLSERISAARRYYDPRLRGIIQSLTDIRKELADAIGVKGFLKELRDLESQVYSRIKKFQRAESIVKAAVMEGK